jgi:hypothetical protein
MATPGLVWNANGMEPLRDPSDAERRARQALQVGDPVVFLWGSMPQRASVTSVTGRLVSLDTIRLSFGLTGAASVGVDDTRLICTSHILEFKADGMRKSSEAHVWDAAYMRRRALFVPSPIKPTGAVVAAKPDTVRHFGDDLTTMFESKLYSDVTVLAADDKEFPVHRCVLAARSDVWKAAFQFQDTAAATSSSAASATEVDVKSKPSTIRVGYSSDVVELLLRYVYTGVCVLPGRYVMHKELLLASHEYDMEFLFGAVCDAVHKTIDQSNVADLAGVLEILTGVCTTGKAKHLDTVQHAVNEWIRLNVSAVSKLLAGQGATASRKRNDPAPIHTDEPVVKKSRVDTAAAVAAPLFPSK